MKIEGEHTLRATREQVWDALMDAQVIANTLPGCRRMEAVADQRFEGEIEIRVGPVQGRFEGGVELSDLDPPNSYHLLLKGDGAPGFVKGEGDIRLQDDGDETTLVYSIDAQVGGRIAGVGQRLLDSSSRVVTRQALVGLERQLEARTAGTAGVDGATATPEVTAAPPSQAEFAGKFARGLLGELIPPERRPLAVIVALAVLIGLILALRACG